jgi:hypothetical protein
MKLAVLPETKTFVATGACIYCGATSDLSKEHIIPLSLAGAAILPKGSCEDCRREVQKYEAPCLNSTFVQARTFLKLPMYDERYRLTDLRVGSFAGDETWPDLTDNFQWDQMPVADHPAAIVVPIFDEPGILSGAALTRSFRVRGQSGRFLNDAAKPPPATLGRSAVFLPFDPGTLAQFIAKIGHGAARAMLGPDAFEPLLPDIIRNRSEHVSHLVGSPARVHWPESRTLHRVTLSLDRGFVVATVQLFARYHIAPFMAVVGRPLNQPLYRHWRVPTGHVPWR